MGQGLAEHRLRGDEKYIVHNLFFNSSCCYYFSYYHYYYYLLNCFYLTPWVLALFSFISHPTLDYGSEWAAVSQLTARWATPQQQYRQNWSVLTSCSSKIIPSFCSLSHLSVLLFHAHPRPYLWCHTIKTVTTTITTNPTDITNIFNL